MAAEDSPVDALLEGIQHLSVTSETNKTLMTINIPKDHKGKIRVLDCLAKFMEVEILDGENQRACEECYKQAYGINPTDDKPIVPPDEPEDQSKKESPKEKPPPLIRKAFKRYLFHTTPPALILHLKRFQQTGLFGRTKKIDDFVQFDEYLETDPFVMSPTAKITEPSAGIKYRLYGVVVHSGGMFGGHYIAYVRVKGSDGQPDAWVYCSDSHTRASSWEEVAKSQAYMLFYETTIKSPIQ